MDYLCCDMNLNMVSTSIMLSDDAWMRHLYFIFIYYLCLMGVYIIVDINLCFHAFQEKRLVNLPIF